MGKNKNKKKIKKNKSSGSHQAFLEAEDIEKNEQTDEHHHDEKHPKKEKTNKEENSASKMKPNNLIPDADSFDYSDDQIPPDWTICEEHFRARISAPERDDDNLPVPNTHCKCCSYIIEREPLPITCDYRKLGFLGVGFPLFFSYIISCVYVLLIILCISGIFNLASNNVTEDCYTQQELDGFVQSVLNMNETAIADDLKEKGCVLAWATRLSLGNKIDHEHTLTAQRWLNVFTVIVLIIYFQYMRRNQRRLDKLCDESLTTPGDYTLMVTDIKTGVGKDYDDELKVFFQDNALLPEKKKANIVSVNLGYNMSNKLMIISKKNRFVKEKQRALAHKNEHGKYPLFYNETNVETQIKLYEEQIEAIEKEFLSGKTDKFCGIAFVTFQTEDEKMQCLKSHYKSLRQRCILYFTDHFRRVIKKSDESSLMFAGQRCLVFEAPEPSDVYWENLHYSNFSRSIRMIMADSFSLFMLACFGVGIYYLNVYQKTINDESKTSTAVTTDPNSSENIKIKIIGTLISVLISAVIEVLKVFIPFIAHFEKKRTRTEYYTSVAVKLGLASFCTSSLITFLITATVIKNYFGQSGLINNQIIIFITNLIIPTFVQLINIPYITKVIQRKIARLKGKNSTLTQQEANTLFQHPEFLIEKNYAQVSFTMIFTCFYASILPLGILFSIGTLILLYWIYKYNLLRKSTVLYDIDSTLAYTMTDLLELSTLAFAISEFVFTKLIFDQYPLPSILCLAFAGANFLLPTELINEKLFNIQISCETKSYKDVEDDFDTDYGRENPATADYARELYEKKEEEEQKLKNKNK